MFFRRHQMSGAGTRIGAYAHLSADARLGDRCQIGDYVMLDARATLGDDVVLGNHARIGSGAILGDGTVVGDYTRVAPGVSIPAGSNLEGSALVLADRIVPRLCSGSIMAFQPGRLITISMISGGFILPWMSEEEASELVDAHMWGDEAALEPYRVKGERPEPIIASWTQGERATPTDDFF